MEEFGALLGLARARPGRGPGRAPGSVPLDRHAPPDATSSDPLEQIPEFLRQHPELTPSSTRLRHARHRGEERG